MMTSEQNPLHFTFYGYQTQFFDKRLSKKKDKKKKTKKKNQKQCVMQEVCYGDTKCVISLWY